MADYQATDIRKLLKALDAIEPKAGNALKRDAKKAAKPLQDGIKKTIPRVSPLSGMNNNGRLGWGQGKPAQSVTTSWKMKRSRRKAETSLLSVRVNSPATALTDYAGRRSGGRTPQGRAMIQKLNQTRRASRWAWFAAEKYLPQVTNAVKGIIEDASKRISKDFK